jgi:hypothetical protein
VAAANVLDECVASHDDRAGAKPFEAPHGAEPSFEPTVISLDRIVRRLLNNVARIGQQLAERPRLDRGPISGHVSRTRCLGQGMGEEATGGCASRVGESRTSMTWPNWSMAR